MKHIKIIVEKHPEGYVAYPLGIQGVVVGESDTYEEALNDVRRFCITAQLRVWLCTFNHNWSG